MLASVRSIRDVKLFRHNVCLRALFFAATLGAGFITSAQGAMTPEVERLEQQVSVRSGVSPHCFNRLADGWSRHPATDVGSGTRAIDFTRLGGAK